MLPVTLFILLLLIPVCLTGPGFIIARRLKLDPLECLAASVAFSILIVYLLFFAGYVAGWPIVAAYVITGLSFIACCAARQDMRRLVRDETVRLVIWATAILAFWSIAWASVIWSYSGGLWSGDWLEHYHRTLFFLYQLPADTKFLNLYLLPARPPLMNVVAAQMLAHVPTEFYAAQVIYILLNLMVFLPCALLTRLFARKTDVRQWLFPLLLIFLASPVFLQNVTFLWTKLLTVQFILAGLYFYFTGWRGGDGVRIVIAFVLLIGGMLTHYSAVPAILFAGLHYLFAVWPARADRWRHIGLITALCVLLFGSWIGWSLAVYGAAGTFGSNTTVTGSAHQPIAQYGVRFISNAVFTFVPPFLRDTENTLPAFDIPLQWLREHAFVAYQHNLLPAFGCCNWLILLALIARGYRRAQAPVRLFWLSGITMIVLLGIAVHGDPGIFGITQVTLLPVVFLGLSCIAAHIGLLSRGWRTLFIGGALIDFAIGIAIHFHYQQLLATTRVGLVNWANKIDNGLIFISDLLAAPSSLMVGLLCGLFVFAWVMIGKNIWSNNDPIADDVSGGK